jgi:hypothetical protein
LLEDATNAMKIATTMKIAIAVHFSIFFAVSQCLLYNAWVILNAKTQEPITTIAMKLNYIWSYLTLHQMKIETSPG